MNEFVDGFQVDIFTTCYGDPGKAVGVVGDSDGSILKEFWSSHYIPAVLVDTTMKMDNAVTLTNQQRLKIFLVAAENSDRFHELMIELLISIWWNHYANVLIVSSAPDISQQCSLSTEYLYIAFENFGVLRAQFVCIDVKMNVNIFTYNPYTPKAPEPWQLLRTYRLKDSTPFSVFMRMHREGGEACNFLNFDKTSDLGGFRFHVTIPPGTIHKKTTGMIDEWSKSLRSTTTKRLVNAFFRQSIWFINNIVSGLNASTVMSENPDETGIVGVNDVISNMVVPLHDRIIYSWEQQSLLAVTQHTAHMSQLEKILSVIDRESRIGMWIVYLITFLFFKFFLSQPVVPALLNLVRLTANASLTTLPSSLAPKIYMACLFMFVVTLQALYTGDLASLLTSVVAYPHVNTMQDIVDLGYKIHTQKHLKNLLAGDPILEGQVINFSEDADCIYSALNDTTVVCVMEYNAAVLIAHDQKLHVSRDVMKNDYVYYVISPCNPLGRRLQARVRTWDECSLRPAADRIFAKTHGDLVDDDEVNQNMVRRVMTLDDLGFAFVILGVGLTCSLVCFAGEIVVHRVSLRLAKRRARDRRRLPWGIKKKQKYALFSALRLRFNALLLFLKRR